VKLAAIDIGSNAMRLLIIRLLPGKNREYKKVEYVRFPLRLGDDAFKQGKLGAEKKKMFQMAMQAFKLIMDIHKVEDYEACATSALRESSNGAQILRVIRKKFDLNIEVISGERESLLILRSILSDLPTKGLFLNIDVGGGSTELTLISDGKPSESVSFPIGTVRLLDGKVDGQAWKDLEAWVRKKAARQDDIRALGTGGNISKLYKMSGAPQKDSFMPIEDLRQLMERIEAMPMQDRIERLRLNPDRADVIVPAAAIYIKVMEWANIDSIKAPSAGLKEGIIQELIERVSSQKS